MAQVVDGLSWLVLGLGSAVLVLSSGAILRMPTFYTRIHAASVNETLGAGLILLGLCLQTAGRPDVAVKLVLVLVFLVLTGPISAHALAQAAQSAGVHPGELERRRLRKALRPEVRGTLPDEAPSQAEEVSPSST